ncbi:hypothetical protein HDG38_007009, partial [Paraburkholderia sp. WSM4177]|nr:hypothetical protein [Paraburkholderia sp. WSM4177]MBB5488742.1 hypothetical protein [Paraburkholderia sp. WSM4180]
MHTAQAIALYGFVTLPITGRVVFRQNNRSEDSRRILGETGEKTPGFKPGRELLSIKRSAQQMTLEREVLPDRTEARQERLRAPGQAETTYTSLAFTRGLMA